MSIMCNWVFMDILNIFECWMSSLCPLYCFCNFYHREIFSLIIKLSSEVNPWCCRIDLSECRWRCQSCAIIANQDLTILCLARVIKRQLLFVVYVCHLAVLWSDYLSKTWFLIWDGFVFQHALLSVEDNIYFLRALQITTRYVSCMFALSAW